MKEVNIKKKVKDETVTEIKTINKRTWKEAGREG